MILAIDIGNSNIVIGIINNNDILFTSRILTIKNKTADEYMLDIIALIAVKNIDINMIEGSILSCVVPSLKNTFIEMVETITKKRPLVISPGIKIGLNIKTDNPAQLGSDLVVCAVSGIQLYKKDNTPLVILDFGTATTISVINSQSEYIGGIIAPGISISSEALSMRTSQLPHISLEAPQNVIGANTIDCMKSGIVIGAAAMIDGIILRIEEELAQGVMVIATGGLALEIIKNTKYKIIYDETLLIKGLKLIYDRNNK